MAFTPKAPRRELIPEGIQQAICYGVVDVGTQDGNFGPKREMRVFWEFPEIRLKTDKDGNEIDKPRVLSKSYSPSLHPKANLTAHLTSWRGKSFTEEESRTFDFFSIVGLTCQITIIHKTAKSGSIYENIASIIGPAKKQETENAPIKYSIEEHGDKIPEGLYDWLKDMIKSSPEYKGEQGPTDWTEPEDTSPQEEEEIPF